MTQLEKTLSAELQSSRQNELRLTAQLSRANDCIQDDRKRLAETMTGLAVMAIENTKLKQSIMVCSGSCHGVLNDNT